MYHSAAMNENVRYDVAVIGAGPAGMVSATTCAQAGASVILLERDAWAGGKLGIQSQPLQGPVTIFGGLNGFEHQARLMNEASDAGVVVRLGVEVDQLSPPAVSGDSFRLTVEGMLDSEGLVSARSVILATGSEEPEPDFPGSNLHGVMRSGAAQVALNVRAQLVGRRIVMAGSGN
jgi:thioredoxin reductase